ncbi:MAG: PHP domain-containing protein [Candidatus Falkowbacteria bacterium]
MLIDLQLHSTYSDGYLTPTQLAEFIAKKGIKVASLTDHNTVSGLYEFRQACKKLKIKPITGLELYVKLKHKKFNLLWYNFDDKRPELHDLLRDSQIRRRNKMRKILLKLESLGFKININKILDKYNHYIPLNHVIDDILLASHNRSKMKNELESNYLQEGEIINKYFKNNKIGILYESYIDFNRVLELRKKIGGILILNHPAKHGYIKEKLWEDLSKLGLDGVEILSPHHSFNAIMCIQHMAKKFNLITTGGSDFHRFENDLISCSAQYFKINNEYLNGVEKIIK